MAASGTGDVDDGGPRLRNGRVIALFAFDVAAAIDLDRVPAVLRPGRAVLSGRKPAPEYVRYAVPPSSSPSEGARSLSATASGRRP